MKKIICVGAAAVDYKLTTIHSLELSTSNPVTSFTALGGVANNVARNLARLTGNVYLQCTVGRDDDGQRLLSHAQSLGIETTHSLILENSQTARYYAVLDPQGELHIALADMGIYDTIPVEPFTASWENWESDSIIFVDTCLSAELLDRVIQHCAKKQLILCIDPVSIPKAKKLPASLAGVYFLKPDRFEAAALTGITITSINDCLKAGEILLAKGVQHVVITLGKSGYVLVNDTYQTHFPALPVEHIADVSGAGDAFIAGVLYELKQGNTMSHACETGAAAAALALQSQHTVAENLSLINLSKLKNREKHHAAVF